MFKSFYTIAFMQQFTEFMELFLSIWELIKTLNLYFVCVFEHQFESGWLVGTWAVWPLPAVCPPGLLALPRPQPAACSALQPTPAHRRGPCSPGSPRSCSAVLSVGALVPKCSEVEVSTKRPDGRGQDRAWSTGQGTLGPFTQAGLTCRLCVRDAMLGQHVPQPPDLF